MGDSPRERGLSHLRVLPQVDRSLARLGVDYLDMYLIHEPDPSTPLEETLAALDDLVHQGKVRYIGASNMSAWLIAKATGSASAAAGSASPGSRTTTICSMGAGAAPVAAAVSGMAGQGKVVCVVSGGGIDSGKLVKILQGQVL